MGRIEDQILSLRFAFDLWNPYRGDIKNWIDLFKSSYRVWRLHKFFWKATFDRLFFPAKKIWYRNIKYKFFSKYYWRDYRYKLRHGRVWLKDQYVLHRNLYKLYSGKAVHWLANLSYEAVNKNDKASRGGNDWLVLMKRRGPIIAWATRYGCETAWKKNTPLLPHEEPEPNTIKNTTIIGLSGIYSQWRRGKLDFSSLSKSDAEKVAIYGLHELNGFPAWFPELASSQPEAVQRVLSKCILGEWQIPAERQHVHEVLSTLFWSGDFYWHLIVDELMKQLLINDPKHIQVLEDAFSILVKQPNPPLSKLEILAANRVRDYQSDSLFFMVWMILWIQLDAIPALRFPAIKSLTRLDTRDADKLILRLCDRIRGQASTHIHMFYQKLIIIEPIAMRVFVPLIYRHIRPKEDIDRSKEDAYDPYIKR